VAEVWIDNNPTKRAPRGPVVGRKNFCGVRSKRGIAVAAMLYSVFETAETTAVKRRDYLQRIVAAEIRNLKTLTLP
jgi:hypothetical protein